MEINYVEDRSKNMPWAFTYKKLGKLKTVEEYTNVISHLNKYGFVKQVEFEEDSMGKQHIHGIVLLPKGFLRKRLIREGFSCHLKEIYDEKDWIKYITKESKTNLNQIYML